MTRSQCGRLLDKGNAQGKDKALLEAACRNHMEVAQLLVEGGANLHPSVGISPLHCAVKARNPEMVSLLLKHGATPDFKPKSGFPTPMDWPERGGNDTIMNLLRDAKMEQATIPANPPSPAAGPASAPPIY